MPISIIFASCYDITPFLLSVLDMSVCCVRLAAGSDGQQRVLDPQRGAAPVPGALRHRVPPGKPPLPRGAGGGTVRRGEKRRLAFWDCTFTLFTLKSASRPGKCVPYNQSSL